MSGVVSLLSRALKSCAIKAPWRKKSNHPGDAYTAGASPANTCFTSLESSEPAKTLYIVSSKSGGTTEPNVFFQYFYDRVRATKGDAAGRNFVAITDPGTAMEKRAKDHGFRQTDFKQVATITQLVSDRFEMVMNRGSRYARS